MSVHPLWDSHAARAAAAVGKPGEVLRLARHAAGLCQADLGARTGYSAATISRFETGRRGRLLTSLSGAAIGESRSAVRRDGVPSHRPETATRQIGPLCAPPL
jgi:hypothetical protein